MEICRDIDCTGCCCCMNVCSSNAISMVHNDFGISIPKIDDEKCVNCGLCIRSCPSNNKPQLNEPKSCYALWINDDHDKRNCASGGAATGLSRYAIDQGGIVFGAAFDDNAKLIHIKAQSQDDLEKLKGSKYLQSYIGLSYRSVKNELETGRIVIFIGTPCQIDGLYHYLGCDYDNLVTVDLICHGTPPQKYLDEYVAGLVTGSVDKVSFRGENDYKITIYSNETIVYIKNSNLDLYFRAFLEGVLNRNNCYTCRYAQKDRISDITIGDYWGLERSTLKEKYSGRISVALINTRKGELFFNNAKHLFTAEERSIEEAVNGNDQLNKPAPQHLDRKLFEENYKQNGFTEAVKSTGIKKMIVKAQLRFIVTFPIRVLRRIINHGV